MGLKSRPLSRRVLILVSCFIGPMLMEVQFWPGAVALILLPLSPRAALRTAGGRPGVMLTAYLILAMKLYLLPLRVP